MLDAQWFVAGVPITVADHTRRAAVAAPRPLSSRFLRFFTVQPYQDLSYAVPNRKLEFRFFSLL